MVVPVELNRPAIGYTDREWEQILAGMIRAIPVRLASWTNRNHTDPGINLLSQVAAVAESLPTRRTACFPCLRQRSAFTM